MAFCKMNKAEIPIFKLDHYVWIEINACFILSSTVYGVRIREKLTRPADEPAKDFHRCHFEVILLLVHTCVVRSVAINRWKIRWVPVPFWSFEAKLFNLGSLWGLKSHPIVHKQQWCVLSCIFPGEVLFQVFQVLFSISSTVSGLWFESKLARRNPFWRISTWRLWCCCSFWIPKRIFQRSREFSLFPGVQQ